MASATSYSHGEASVQITRRRAHVGWLSPTTQKPSAIISSNHGLALTEEGLHAVARALSKLDRFLLLYCEHLYKRISNGELNQGDTSAQQKARHDLADLLTITAQFQDINRGQSVFSNLYLKERHMLYYWGMAFSFLNQMLTAGQELHQPTLNNMERITELAADIESTLLDAASAGVLVSDYRLVFPERWDLLENVFESYHRYSQSPRTVSKWPELAQQIQQAMKTHSPQNSNVVLDTQSGIFTITLWLTFIGTALSNVWTFALAYRYSEHLPGTTKDADFWVLIQSCITQAFTLIISSIPLKSKSSMRKSTWAIPTVFALACTAAAPPLYLTVPTEWATFVLLIATGIQSFMILQLVSTLG